MRARSSTTVIIGSSSSSSGGSSSSSASVGSIRNRIGVLMARQEMRRAAIVTLVLLAGLIPCLTLVLAHERASTHLILDSSASDILQDVLRRDQLRASSLVPDSDNTDDVASTNVHEIPFLNSSDLTPVAFEPANSGVPAFSDQPESEWSISSLAGDSSASAAEAAFTTSEKILKVGCPSLELLTDGAQEEGELRASDFGGDFVFGFATSAAQVEGAVAEGGRGRSIWDDFAERPGKIKDASKPSVTADQFHRYKDDVALLKAMGASSYRFSISWSRIIPDGMGAVNEAGIQHYSNLIDELLANGIAPAVTLYHWDLPSALHQPHGGWLNASIVAAFVRYADVCFSRFGGRVRTWITFNEPQQTAVQGHGYGTMAPGRCSNRSVCETGDSAAEPYIVAHNILRAHAAAVEVYRSRHGRQRVKENGEHGRIGMTLDCVFLYPADQTPGSEAAAERGMEFAFAWFADPLFTGDYPPSMRQAVGSRLPSFSAAESSLLIGSSDFLGLNFYTAQFAAQNTAGAGETADVADGVAPWVDCHVDMTAVSPVTGKLIGERTASSWLHVVPSAVQHMLTWISHRYPAVPIIITENGMSEPNIPSRSLVRSLCDDQRVRFYRSYLSNILQAKRQGVPVQGYYAWSLLDNWEWAMGFSERFGAVYVNFTDPALPRFPKASALWFKHFLKAHSMHIRGHVVQ
ncbi:hypothetical protein CLOM_g6594 [Closterium sp. NIES-68]|nr:hypothetical protein CLOM_g6594 [Closterium sp. NIES-68]